MKQNKKGAAVWISAVLYFGLGVILIAIILGASLPTINKIRDKNIITQTKEIMHNMDAAVREVVRQGPGSQRVMDVQIKKGQFIIDPIQETMTWTYNSKVAISEIDETTEIQEGSLKIHTKSGIEEGTYDIQIQLTYTSIADIQFSNPTQTIEGLSSLSIKNEGINELTKMPKVGVSEI